MLFPQCGRPSFTPIQNKWHNYGSEYFNFYVSREQAGRQKNLNGNVASILQIQSALALSVLVILIS
jgi:hypothetical protein